MSEHTLSGVDLTNGKRLNLKFTSGDLLGTGDLFDTTKIVEDIINLNVDDQLIKECTTLMVK